ncbi:MULTISPECIES: pyridoxamine 5'-phosphate oxidase family protein [unclassified Janthinobacterium]|uniref:pyridoxamine 5'-phosphate oxidase family protein n=1 Tax=unclassified Janthinobacterium TaxID=2610881 RepID=UPI001621AE33|nr:MULTISPECIES: pyridoxamine 5'-phosphate oxidase family protein [unclassified Janthinobacterium]MBB5367310.1 general stress protein 26 [Janthinobacterium sp. K2C7]MBB5380212.1 general stress protein 26 [Janthinobacterium sp. K2Li3]MBB5385692.1 general stress protein 26 [Janthinobacterium sp. K2E3]
MSYNSEQLNIIAGKIKQVKFGMFTTSDDTRTLTSRPLTLQQTDSEGRMWFFVSEQTPFVRDLLNNPQVNISFAEPGDSLYVSVCGHAELVKDRSKAEELWSPLVKAWFPGGLDDPQLALIKVSLQSAEYWDVNSSKMTQFFEMAKAAITGDRPKDLGEHGRVDL